MVIKLGDILKFRNYFYFSEGSLKSSVVEKGLMFAGQSCHVGFLNFLEKKNKRQDRLKGNKNTCKIPELE